MLSLVLSKDTEGQDLQAAWAWSNDPAADFVFAFPTGNRKVLRSLSFRQPNGMVHVRDCFAELCTSMNLLHHSPSQLGIH